MNRIDEICFAVQNIRYDIKAEAVLGDLVADGADSDEFVVVPQGSFRRRFARDVAFAKKLKLNNGAEVAAVHLNRDGIYDTLPEGFFHQNTDKTGSNPKMLAHESRRLRDEEKTARNFFLPFENEIFYQGLILELEERKILNRLSENLSSDFSPEFWGLDQSHDPEYLSRLVRLLHLSHKVAGNTRLTEKCLETILQEKVKVSLVEHRTVSTFSAVRNEYSSCNRLGYSVVGSDFVCGNKVTSTGLAMRFDIGPLKNKDAGRYCGNGPAARFLNCFYNYFVPVELEIVTNIIIGREHTGFTLGSDQEEGTMLGYTTAI